MTRHRNSQSSKWAVHTKNRAKIKLMESILALDFLKQIIYLKDMEDTALNAALLTYMRRCRQRKSCQYFHSKLTDRQFRQYFRMSRDCFAYLCAKIESNVGEQKFKSKN